MNLSLFIIDAFADRPLTGQSSGGLPARSLAACRHYAGNRGGDDFSETVFFAPEPQGHDLGIRWFTPTREVDLIGHATLAAGYLVLEQLRRDAVSVCFVSGCDKFTVCRDGDALSLEMPALPPRPIEASSALLRGLGRPPKAVLACKHYLCVFDRADDVAALAPDMAIVAKLDLPAVIVTAPVDGGEDFVSRFFAPANGVPEDAVSGVAHLCLAPYWSQRLGKKHLVGRQLSPRGGLVKCEELGSRVRLGGNAVVFLRGRITI